MFDGSWRDPVERLVDPVGVRLHRVGVSANGLTVLGVVGAIATAAAVASGRLGLGAVLLAVAAST